MTTFEEARRCPKCGEPGSDVSQRPGRYGSVMHTIICRNGRCRWFDQPGWLIQVRSDGTIPESDIHDKSFPKIPDRTELVQADLEKLLELTRKKDGEIRG
jgi:hypothetical protein